MITPIYLPPGLIEGPTYGTEEWSASRRGLVTASRFGDVLTEPRSKADKEAGKMSETARSYMLELVAQAITGMERVGGKSAAMERGVEKEADAIDAYERSTMATVEKGRILIRPELGLGATPDGFVEDDPDGPGIIECKCPEPKTHLQNWLGKAVPEDYIEQVQGQLWISGRAWCDFVSFDDRFPGPMQLVVVRVHRDEEVIARLDEKVPAFARAVRDQIASIRAFLASCTPQEARTVVQGLEDQLEGLHLSPEAAE